MDVVRVSYPDLIGVDRGRDVLRRRARARGRGTAWPSAAPSTTPRPQGDVVPVPGGLDAGLPDINVVPDLSTLTPLPVGAGRGLVPRRRADSTTARPRRESPRDVARRVVEPAGRAGPAPRGRPRARVLRAASRTAARRRGAATPTSPATSTSSGARATRDGLLLTMLRHLRDAGLRRDRRQPRVLRRPVRDQPRPLRARRRRRPGVPAQVRRPGDRPPRTTCWRPSWPSRSTTRAAAASTCTSRWSTSDGAATSFGDPAGAHGLSAHGRAAVAGVLAHAPALAALLNPTINSYKRFGPDTLAPVADRLGPGQPQRHGPDPAGARRRRPDGAPARRRHRQPLPGDRGASARPCTSASATSSSRRRRSRATATTPPRRRCCRSGWPDALDALEADTELARRARRALRRRRSWPTSATRSSGSSATSPTGSSASTPTTSDPPHPEDRTWTSPRGTARRPRHLRRRPALGAVRPAARRGAGGVDAGGGAARRLLVRDPARGHRRRQPRLADVQLRPRGVAGGARRRPADRTGRR